MGRLRALRAWRGRFLDRLLSLYGGGGVAGLATRSWRQPPGADHARIRSPPSRFRGRALPPATAPHLREPARRRGACRPVAPRDPPSPRRGRGTAGGASEGDVADHRLPVGRLESHRLARPQARRAARGPWRVPADLHGHSRHRLQRASSPSGPTHREARRHPFDPPRRRGTRPGDVLESHRPQAAARGQHPTPLGRLALDRGDGLDVAAAAGGGSPGRPHPLPARRQRHAPGGRVWRLAGGEGRADHHASCRWRAVCRRFPLTRRGDVRNRQGRYRACVTP